MNAFAIDQLRAKSIGYFHDRLSTTFPFHEGLDGASMGDDHCRALLDASADCVKLLDLEGRLLWMNPNGLRCLEITDPGSILDKPWEMLWPRHCRPLVAKALRAALAKGTARFTGLCPTTGGAERWWDVVVSRVDAHGDRPTQFAVKSRDVTEWRATVQELRWLTKNDSLTSLPNRRVFVEELERRVEKAKRGHPFALAILDLNRFKQISDDLGIEAGDAILRVFATRLSNNRCPGDFVARLDGDKFALILGEISSAADAVRAVQSILNRVSEPFRHGEQIIDCVASAGIAIFPDHVGNGIELMKNAEIALNHTRAPGRAQCVCFDGDMRQALQQRESMIYLARAALDGRWILPYYQPKVDLVTQQIRGFEALLRWQRPGGDLHHPETIWEAFDDPELGSPISEAMHEAIIVDMVCWEKLGITLPVAINASATDLRLHDFADRLLGRLDRASIPPGRIELEVTESVFLGPAAVTVGRTLKRLSAAGMRIALDDFGTGYASLSHLKQFPIDVIKIDRSFVQHILTDPDDRVIAGTIASLGASMSIEIVAEGIENAEQAQLLRALRCDIGQGFLYGHAIPASDIPGLIRESARIGVRPTRSQFEPPTRSK